VATSDEVRQIAIDLAERGVETDPAVRELLVFCGDHRVSVAGAIALLDMARVRGSWA
jgi:hypothetical protein